MEKTRAIIETASDFDPMVGSCASIPLLFVSGAM